MTDSKLEILTAKTAAWLRTCGYKGMNYPRWRGILYNAEVELQVYRYCKDNNYPISKHYARFVMALQPFTGLRPEWVEQNLRRKGS